MTYLPSFLRPSYHFLAYNLLQRHRLNRTVMTSVNGIDLVIDPTVMHPRVFKSGKIFAEYLVECDLRWKAVLDIGTGSGILAIAGAKSGAQVVATDLNPRAVMCARANVDRNSYTSSVTLVESDLFQALGNRKFDVIMFNPPYLANAPSGPYGSAMQGGASLDVLKRFAAQAGGHLNAGGVLLLILSTDSPLEQLFSIFSNSGYTAEVLRRRSGLFEEFLVCRFTPLKIPGMTVEMRDRTLICPSCLERLTRESNGWRCDRELLRFGYTKGIPDFILESRRPDIERFLRTYQAVRRKEGWGSKDRIYYLSLPETDTTGRRVGIWNIRSQSYRSLIGDLKCSVQPGAKVLDLGAGNGWLSIRLAKEGYEVIGADVNLDEEDGLLAPTAISDNGKQLFERVRAEFDHLPFPERSFDVIVFNASVHYSKDPLRSIRDTVRLLSEHGVLYILDSPCYEDPNDGIAMLREKTLDIESKTGWKVSEKDRGTFLGPDFVRRLTRECAVQTIEPHSRFRRQLRRAIARILRRHAPATFPVMKIQKRL